MDVKFITTSSNKLDTVPIVDGQVIALSDISAYFYDMGSTRHLASSQIVGPLPDIGVSGVWYVVTDKGSEDFGIHVWDTNSSRFVKVATDFSLQVGEPGGLAELDENGKVLSSQLPSYVDDVIEYESVSEFPEGESGKIYVDTSTNKAFRWSGSSYVEISPGVALGETASTAYRGDRGKVAYEHAFAKGAQLSQGLYVFSTNAQGHVSGGKLATSVDIANIGIDDGLL